MDVDIPTPPAPSPSSASASASASYQPRLISPSETLYTHYPPMNDAPVGQPHEPWNYEMRRKPQLILPNLYLGPYQTSKELDVMKALGITHIVCIRDQREAFLVKPRFLDDFQYLTMDISDHEDQNLIRIMPQVFAFIQSARSAGGTVFVHCNGGISLGPSVVVGYVMQDQQWNFEEALRFVQSRRYCISPNAGFMYQLKEFEPIYRAQLAASAARDQQQQQQHAASFSSSSAPPPSSRRKRTGDDVDQEEGNGEDDGGGNGNGNGGEASEGGWSHRPMARMQRTGDGPGK